MKRIFGDLILLLIGGIAVHFMTIVHAQSTGIPASFSVAGTHTTCPAVATGVTTYCAASDGLWQSIQGAAYAQLATIQPAGVTSFNKRTGDVTPAANDYSFAQLSSPPTSFSCPTGSVSAGSTGAMSGSGCTFK